MTLWQMDNFLRLRRLARQHERIMARHQVEVWW